MAEEQTQDTVEKLRDRNRELKDMLDSIPPQVSAMESELKFNQGVIAGIISERQRVQEEVMAALVESGDVPVADEAQDEQTLGEPVAPEEQ